MFCKSNKAMIDAFDRLFTESKGLSLASIYFSALSNIHSADTSGLFYETKYLDESKAIVRISGNVLIKPSNNNPYLIPYNKLSRTKRDWFRLQKEFGKWKICDDTF